MLGESKKILDRSTTVRSWFDFTFYAGCESAWGDPEPLLEQPGEMRSIVKAPAQRYGEYARMAGTAEIASAVPQAQLPNQATDRKWLLLEQAIECPARDFESRRKQVRPEPGFR